MTWPQALAYFFREALTSLRRGWRVSLLAVLTIGVSLFVGGLFGLVSLNLNRQIETWEGEARVAVYLGDDATSDDLLATAEQLEPIEWVAAIHPVTREEAEDRFRSSFPDLGTILETSEASSLPPSIELELGPGAPSTVTLETIQRELGSASGVTQVDDDRTWLARLEEIVEWVRFGGSILGLVLLTAAVFTIASVIRLTAYRYREEISVMRQVGATELLIRCPFYLEGMLQGFAGGLVALMALAGAWLWIRPSDAPTAFEAAFASRFLPPIASLAMICFGTLAGTLGAVLSLRREIFDHDEA